MSDHFKIRLDKNIPVLKTTPSRYILEKINRKFIPKFINSNDKNILDLGCFKGTYHSFFKGKKYYGVDIEPKYFDRKKNFGKNINFIVGNGTRLCFKEEMFDFVFCSQTLEHIKEDEKVLEEVTRVLKKDHLCYIGVPSSYYWLIGEIPYKFFGMEGHGYHYYSKNKLCKMLEKNGYNIVIMLPQGGIVCFFIELFGSWIKFLFREIIKSIKISERESEELSIKKLKKNLTYKEKVYVKILNLAENLDKVIPPILTAGWIVFAKRNKFLFNKY